MPSEQTVNYRTTGSSLVFLHQYGIIFQFGYTMKDAQGTLRDSCHVLFVRPRTLTNVLNHGHIGVNCMPERWYQFCFVTCK